MKLKSNYQSLIMSLAYAYSPQYQQWLERHKNKESIELIAKQVSGHYYSMIVSSPDSMKAYADKFELIKFYKILPETSWDTKKEANELIREASMKIEELIAYDPQFYLELYKVLVSSTQSNSNKVAIPIPGFSDNSFITWFANSVVTDENEMPLMVYHGTKHRSEFTRFRFDLFPGMYFGANKSYAEWFKNLASDGKGTLFQVYLKVTNPIDFTEFGVDLIKYDDFVNYIELKYGYKLSENKALKAASDLSGGLIGWQYIRNGIDWLNQIKNDGVFDGFMYYENNPNDLLPDGSENITKAWLVFRPEQIKAAYGNFTNSLAASDIRFEKGGVL